MSLQQQGRSGAISLYRALRFLRLDFLAHFMHVIDCLVMSVDS